MKQIQLLIAPLNDSRIVRMDFFGGFPRRIRYTISFLLLMDVISNSFAQQQSEISLSGQIAESTAANTNPAPMANDTLKPPGLSLPCGKTYYIYTLKPPYSGNAFGNNTLGETEAAQKYNYTGTISEVLVWYANKKIGTTGSSTAKIYSINASAKTPETVLGESAAITTGNIKTPASYTFSPAVSVSGGFAAAVVFPTNGDSVGLKCTADGCCSSDSLSWVNIFGGWRSARFFKINVDLIILPVATINTGVNEYSTAGLSLMGANPNPAQDFVTIRYRIDEPATVSVEVFDLTGRVIEHSSEKPTVGVHDMQISLQDISAGNYYYTIKTEKSQLTSKFVITK